jgi:phosphatidate cytidylyltransferase
MLPLLPLVLFLTPGWVLAASVSVLSALSVWELLGGTGFLPKKRFTAYAAVFSVCVPLWIYFKDTIPSAHADILPLVFITAFVLLLFAGAVADHANIRFTHIAVVFTSALVIPYFFSSLLHIANGELGRYYIMLPFIAAFLTDICAYFAGITLGKRALTPVSPKKTVEGAIGGLIGVLLGMASYGLIMHLAFSMLVSYPLLLLYGLLGGIAGMLGDLSMSLIKREFRLKDFGSLLPGHGGVLDRFDSLLFTVPVLDILFRLLPAIK